MKKKYKDFIIMLTIFMVFLLRNSINEIIIIISKNFDFSNACEYTCSAVMTENKSLKEIIDFKENPEYEYITSRVKYRDVLDFTDELQIFKGSKDGIKENQAVINDKGLIGIIKESDKHISKVELITNKNSNISVRVNDTYGILKYIDNKLIISNITNSSKIVEKGSAVYTSGLGNLPGEIYIGTVSEVALDDLELEQIITVTPAVDFSFITYLMVVSEK